MPEPTADELTTEDEPTDAPEVSGARAILHKAKRHVSLLKKLLPWFSLAAGVIGAFLMDRSPKSAWLIILMAVFGWAVLIGFTLLGRLDPEQFEGRKRTLVQAAQFGILVLTQSVMQNCLLFALPFYVLAASLVPTHIGFLVVLGGVTAITLWDPVYEAVISVHPFVSFSIQGFSTFVALNAVFPPLGLSNRWSLVVAGLCTAVGVPLLAFLTAPRVDPDDEDAVRRRTLIRRGALIAGAVAVVMVPVIVLLGGASVIPPAPLRLLEGGIGTELVRKEWSALPAGSEPLHKPKQLVCATRIGAPRGLKDELFHVWAKDGEETDRIKLDVKVRNEERGYGTYSRKRRLGKSPAGVWTCSVETASGQLLGRIRRSIAAEPAP
jgi:hypothetical protein